MEIGRVVASRDHADYVVQVYGPAEIAHPPTASDHAFGQFVKIPIDETESLIGIIYTTELVNPEFGTMGPRLSTPGELPVFSPDYLAETATLVGVAIVGSATRLAGQSIYDQATPRLAASVDAEVHALPDERVIAFHRGERGLRLSYFPRLLARPFPSLPDLLCGVIDRLAASFPEEHRRLEVARQNIRWRAAVQTR